MDNSQHNQLLKICFDGSKHLKHVLSSEEINKMTMIENRFPLSKLPVCGSCERLGLWGKEMQCFCKHCGTITRSPITYSTYLAGGYDVDPTGATAKKVLMDRNAIKEKILPKYDKVSQLILAGR